ncbi:hypothetical protein H6F96_05540 [Microcoleus sp. FACHB-53]|nr:hypothetical protein [Microcoleus sp. FACHB-53]
MNILILHKFPEILWILRHRLLRLRLSRLSALIVVNFLLICAVLHNEANALLTPARVHPVGKYQMSSFLVLIWPLGSWRHQSTGNQTC